MKINAEGLKLIKDFEGCKLKAYQDIVGVFTIGYGDTLNVKSGDEITQAEADKRLQDRLESFESGVSKLLKVAVTDNRFSAMVCFAYNVGLENFKRSTLLNCVNKIEWEHAAKEFLRWNRAGGKEVAGLTRRREAEKALFSKVE